MPSYKAYATRLCLSGCESRRLLDTFRDFKVPHIQISYYYLRRVFGDPLDFEEYAKDFETVIIDSGTVYGNLKNEDQKAELVQDYASYLSALNKRVYTAAVYERGADIDKILPDEMLIYPLDDIRGVHDNDLAAVFSNLKYVGVSNKEASAKGGENLIPIFAQAQKRGAYIHAFGTSSRKILSKYPFYSANSSSWRSGSRYLNTYIYEGPGRGLRLYQPTDKSDPVKTEKETRSIRRRQANLVKVRHPDIYGHIDWEEAYEGDSWEVDKGNLAQWTLYQQDLSLNGNKAYYLSEDEKKSLLARKRDLLGKSAIAGIPNNRDEYKKTPIEKTLEEKGVEREDDNSDVYMAGSNDNPVSNSDEELIVDAEVVDELPANQVDIEGVESSTENTPAFPAESVALAVSTPRLTPIDQRMGVLRECNFCILADRCPKYEPDNKCAYGLPPEKQTYSVDNIEGHILEDSADLLAIQKDRILQLYLEEKMDASGANKDLTNNLKLYMEMVQLLSEATDKRDEVSIHAKGPGIMDLFKKK